MRYGVGSSLQVEKEIEYPKFRRAAEKIRPVLKSHVPFSCDLYGRMGKNRGTRAQGMSQTGADQFDARFALVVIQRMLCR